MPLGSHGNLLREIGDRAAGEAFETLLERPGLRIERIVSRGHASPPGFWYEQERGEWVAVIQGRARLAFDDGREPLDMAPGTWIDLPAGCRHRVEWTQPDGPTIWLAVHYDG